MQKLRQIYIPLMAGVSFYKQLKKDSKKLMKIILTIIITFCITLTLGLYVSWKFIGQAEVITTLCTIGDVAVEENI